MWKVRIKQKYKCTCELQKIFRSFHYFATLRYKGFKGYHFEVYKIWKLSVELQGNVAYTWNIHFPQNEHFLSANVLESQVSSLIHYPFPVSVMHKIDTTKHFTFPSCKASFSNSSILPCILSFYHLCDLILSFSPLHSWSTSVMKEYRVFSYFIWISIYLYKFCWDIW